jgi:hypothetical protein
MCRSIKQLRNTEIPATEEEIRDGGIAVREESQWVS